MGQIEPGQNLGRYRIVRRLGAGAMGEVYLAEDPQIDRRLAIKIVLVGEGSIQEVAALKERLLREAKAAGRLLHPHVVALFDAGEADGVFYLAFEYVAGQDLSKRKDVDPPLTLGQVLRLVREAASGLSAAHVQGIIHRDIKPSNLLLDESGTLKIADFGIAKRMGEGSELTMTGTVVGSPHYLSPEQVRGEDLGPRSDLFSLGVVLYELLTHRRPFEAEALTTLVYRILNEEAQPLGELRPGLPPRLEAMVRKLLSKDADNRYQSADELILEIETLEAELSPRALATTAALSGGDLEETRELPSSGAPTPPPPPLPETASGQASGAAAQKAGGRRRGLVILALGLAAVVLLAVALWLVLGRQGDGGDDSDTASQEASSELIAQQQESPPDALSAGGEQPPDLPATEDLEATDRIPEESASPSGPESESKEPAPTSDTTPDSSPVGSSRSVVSEPAPRTSAPPATTTTRQQPISTAPRKLREPTPPAEDPEPEPVVERVAVDRELVSGLQVRFDVSPPDTFVQLREEGEGRFMSLGQARQWDPKKEDGRLYTMPSVGVYYVRLRKTGMKDQLIRVDVKGSGTTTTLTARMSPLAAQDLELGDLEVIRVAESVAIVVKPAEAASRASIVVNGETRGKAGRNAWIRLPVGRHRLSVEAPGFGRHDLVVEVLPGADDRRKRVDVVLTRER